MKLSAPTIKAFVIAVIIAGLFGVISILASDGMGMEGAKAFAISMCFILYGLLSAAPMVLAEKPEYKTLGVASMIVSTLAFILTVAAILAEITDAGFLKFIASLFILSLGLAHICLLHHFNLQNKYAHYARVTATIAITLFTLLIIVRVFDTFMLYESFLYNQSTAKITVVAFIIDLTATLLVPLCNRLQVTEKVEMIFDETPPVDQMEKQEV